MMYCNPSSHLLLVLLVIRGAGEKCSSLRTKLEVYTEVYIVFICVYFHVILTYLVTTLLD